MKLKYDLCFQPMGDIIMAVAVGDNSKDSNCMIQLNDVGQFMISQLKEDVTAEDIISSVLEEYDVDEETARRNVLEFIDELKKENLLDV